MSKEDNSKLIDRRCYLRKVILSRWEVIRLHLVFSSICRWETLCDRSPTTQASVRLYSARSTPEPTGNGMHMTQFDLGEMRYVLILRSSLGGQPTV